VANGELKIKFSFYSSAFILGFPDHEDFLTALSTLKYYRRKTVTDKFSYRQLQRIDRRLAKGVHYGRIEQGQML